MVKMNMGLSFEAGLWDLAGTGASRIQILYSDVNVSHQETHSELNPNHEDTEVDLVAIYFLCYILKMEICLHLPLGGLAVTHQPTGFTKINNDYGLGTFLPFFYWNVSTFLVFLP